ALVGDSDEVADERPLLLYRAPQPAVKTDDAPLDLLVGEEPHRRAGLVGVLRVVVLAGLDAQPEQCLRLVRVLVRRPVLFLGVDLVADRAFVREEWDGFFGLCCLGHWDMLLTAAAYTASVVVFLGGGLVTAGPLLVCGRAPRPRQERKRTGVGAQQAASPAFPEAGRDARGEEPFRCGRSAERAPEPDVRRRLRGKAARSAF